MILAYLWGLASWGSFSGEEGDRGVRKDGLVRKVQPARAGFADRRRGQRQAARAVSGSWERPRDPPWSLQKAAEAG